MASLSAPFPVPVASASAGMRVRGYVLSAVLAEHQSLWQWRTIATPNALYALPFLLHCAPGVCPRRPLLHPMALASLSADTQTPRPVRVPSPIGSLLAEVADGWWLEEFFTLLQRAARRQTHTHTTVFARHTHQQQQQQEEVKREKAVPPSHRNVIGAGLAETVLAIDRYGALLARREMTMANACWAVLCDSKPDVQPYLRSSAAAIETDLLAATAAHVALNTALGEPMQRPLLALADYPRLAGWE